MFNRKGSNPMSKIMFGAGVADARNALGGHVFSKNRNGAYLRMKVSPSQPRSATVLMVRANFGNIAAAWGGALTDPQRAAWTALAATVSIPDQFGNPQVPTGLQYYMRVNRNLFTIGQPRLDVAPGGTAVESLVSLALTATFTGTVLSLAFTPTPLGASSHLVVTMTPEISPGKSFFTPFLKQIFADPAPATASPKVLLTPWSAKFGALIAGQKIGVSAYIIDDVTGASSAPAATTAITGA